MSGLKRSSKRLMMIVRVPKRQNPLRNGRNDPYTHLNLNTVGDYIVITGVHQNPNFSPRAREKNYNFEGLLWGEQNLGPCSGFKYHILPTIRPRRGNYKGTS